MKAKKAKPTASPQQRRVVNLYARFTPDGSDEVDEADAVAFCEFWGDAQRRILQARMAERRSKVAHQNADFAERTAKVWAAWLEVLPIAVKVQRNKVPVELAIREIEQLLPDRETLQEVMDIFGAHLAGVKEAPAETAANKKNLELYRLHQSVNRASKAILDGLRVLGEAAVAGNTLAAEDLGEAAISAALWLRGGETKKPDLFRSVARRWGVWPVLASAEPGWEKEATKRIAGLLELGAESPMLHPRFRQARGLDAIRPARVWAKAAVRAIAETRWRFSLFEQIGRDFGSEEKFTKFCSETGWQIGQRPAWVSKAERLSDFSRKSVPQWYAVIREMIREQMPDFHSRPEWSNQRGAAKEGTTGTPGKVKSIILDDIRSALERVAPIS